MSKKDKDDIKSWYQKDKKDWTEFDKLEEYIDSQEWDELPQWKKDIFRLELKNNQQKKRKIK